nr:hypothetical protein [Tepidimonas taiwanensis]
MAGDISFNDFAHSYGEVPRKQQLLRLQMCITGYRVVSHQNSTIPTVHEERAILEHSGDRSRNSIHTTIERLALPNYNFLLILRVRVQPWIRSRQIAAMRPDFVAREFPVRVAVSRQALLVIEDLAMLLLSLI